MRKENFGCGKKPDQSDFCRPSAAGNDGTESANLVSQQVAEAGTMPGSGTFHYFVKNLNILVENVLFLAQKQKKVTYNFAILNASVYNKSYFNLKRS